MIIELNSNIDVIDGKDDRLVIGYFDGLHHGHMTLFEDDLANTSVLTFKNHPSKKDFLYSSKERFNQLEKIGVKNIYVFDLTQTMTAQEFIDRYIKKLEPKEIIVGENFRFGTDQQDVEILKKDFIVQVIPNLEGYSTSIIKRFIIEGDLETVNTMLMWPYYRTGIVEDGTKTARNTYVRTANINVKESLITINPGVYASKTLLEDKWYKSVSVVGKPPVGDSKPFIETNLIDYDGPDFYSKEIKVIFYKKIGDIKKYRFKYQLVNRIKKMIQIASEYSWVKIRK